MPGRRKLRIARAYSLPANVRFSPEPDVLDSSVSGRTPPLIAQARLTPCGLLKNQRAERAFDRTRPSEARDPREAVVPFRLANMSGPADPAAAPNLPSDHLPLAGGTADPAVRLQHFATRLIRLARTSHKEHALSSAQYSVMALLSNEPDLSVVELARREGVAHPSMSRLIAGLIRLHLVLRLPDLTDKRSGLLRLTPSGEKLYREVAERRVMLFRILVSQLSPEALTEILGVVDQLAGPVEAMFRKE